MGGGMFWKKRASIDQDEQDWLIETWGWLDKVNGPAEGDYCRELMLPGRLQFPDTDLRGHARAEYYFDLVRHFCGMHDWPCKLVPQSEQPKLGNSVVFGSVKSKGALGRQSGDYHL